MTAGSKIAASLVSNLINYQPKSEQRKPVLLLNRIIVVLECDATKAN